MEHVTPDEPMLPLAQRVNALSDEDKTLMAALYLKGWTAAQLAERFGCSKRTVYYVMKAKGCLKSQHPEAVWTRRMVSGRRAPRAAAEVSAGAGSAPVQPPLILPDAWSPPDLDETPPAAPRSGRPRNEDRTFEAELNDGEPWTPHPAQTPDGAEPRDSDWRTWLFLGGRGAGKTRAGAEWLADAAARSPGARLALVGPGLHEVREVMIEGPSGIRRLPGRERPRWEASRRRLVWSNGSEAFCFSAEDPESLRGAQHHAAWADEFCVWRGAGDTLALLRLGLRLGPRPRLAVTTTPKPIPALRRLIAEPGCTTSREPTAANAAWLAPAFVDGLQALYGGTRLARQELDGELLDAPEGAMWTRQVLDACRGPAPSRGFDRVAVGVDPPAGAEGNACGIVVCGRLGDRAWVLADRTAQGLSPHGWARQATEAARAFGAQVIVAEANQGGDMVKSVLTAVGAPCAVKLVHARAGKRARAEPAAALYEQGRVTHAAGPGESLERLEEELCGFSFDAAGWNGASPDRADALVWALTELMVRPGLGAGSGPRIRFLD